MLYADASALVKLVIGEAESRSVARLFSASGTIVSSIVAVVEVGLAVGRSGADQGARAAERMFEEVSVIGLSEPIARAAQRQASRRALDAIHLATALSLGGELEGFVTYDRRLGESARHAGLHVITPR